MHTLPNILSLTYVLDSLNTSKTYIHLCYTFYSHTHMDLHICTNTYIHTHTHTPSVGLHIGGGAFIIILQGPAVLMWRPLVSMLVPLTHSLGAAAALSQREVVVALPLGLQTQLIPVVLNVRLLLQSHAHLQEKGNQPRLWVTV